MTTFCWRRTGVRGDRTRPRIPGKLNKMGYRRRDHRDGARRHRGRPHPVLGGRTEASRGFYQMMDASEVGGSMWPPRSAWRSGVRLRHRYAQHGRPSAADRPAPGGRLQAGRDGDERSRAHAIMAARTPPGAGVRMTSRRGCQALASEVLAEVGQERSAPRRDGFRPSTRSSGSAGGAVPVIGEGPTRSEGRSSREASSGVRSERLQDPNWSIMSYVRIGAES